MTLEHLQAQGGARLRALAAVAMAAISLAACASGPRPTATASNPGYKVGKPYQVRGVWYTPAEQPSYEEVGVGSWYGEQFHNRYTANGEVFDMDRLSAAHTTLPLPSLVEVTNLDNGRKVVVRVNDRGPFVDGRIIDLSRAAAEKLGYQRQGIARVRVRYVGRAPLLPADGKVYEAVIPPKYTPPAPPRVMASQAPRPLPSGWLAQPEYLPDVKPPGLQPKPPVLASSGALSGGYQVQAGAFSVRANAERAATQLASAGPSQIIETQKDGGVLYRLVVVGGDPEQAEQVRQRVASLGYPDARLVWGE
jgi:rare lipoprotein A